MTRPVPGQAAYEAYCATVMAPMPKWGELARRARRAWEAAEQAAVAAFLAGDSASAEILRDALAAQERPAPELAAAATALEDCDPRLLRALRALGDEWGPLGVAIVAASFTSREALIANITSDSKRQPLEIEEQPGMAVTKDARETPDGGDSVPLPLRNGGCLP